MSIREARALGSALFIVAGFLQVAAPTASAQLYTADPYDPAGRGFRQYAYPNADEGYPGSYAARSRIVRPNQFDRSDDDLGFPTSGLGARRGLYGNYDRLSERDFVPNEKADRQYFADRERRERAMLKATLERDPKKRDQMIREAEQEARKESSERSLSVRRTVPAQGSVPPAPVRPSSGSRATSSGSARSGVTVPPPPSARGAGGSAATRGASVPARPSPSSTASGPRSSIPPPPSSSRTRSDDASDPLPTDVLERNKARDRPRTVSTRRLPTPAN